MAREGVHANYLVDQQEEEEEAVAVVVVVVVANGRRRQLFLDAGRVLMLWGCGTLAAAVVSSAAAGADDDHHSLRRRARAPPRLRSVACRRLPRRARARGGPVPSGRAGWRRRGQRHRRLLLPSIKLANLVPAICTCLHVECD